MAYQALYRKWRPLTFDDVIGQTHITRTLKNQILSGKTAHAYLFCGTRGTGKTSAAKIFSRAINCLNNTDGNPCNECSICKGLFDGSVLDVVEIDAASNNGVDNIRDIRDEVMYLPAQAKYKIYIIDEVHMLSAGAFNALLKTLEEPPAHVIFILATTEMHKLPQTILSRCQRYDFKRIKTSDIKIRLKEISTTDNIEADDDALDIIASLGDGSMRDALSILERCIQASTDRLSANDVEQTLGSVGNDRYISLVDAVISENAKIVIEAVDDIFSNTGDLSVFVDGLIKYFRDLLICKVANGEGLDYNSEVIIKMQRQSEKITIEKISNAINVLSQATSSAKWSSNPKVVYELSLVKLTRPEFDVSYDALLDRVSTLEEQLKNGVVLAGAEPKEKEEEKAEKKEEENPPSHKLSATKPFAKDTLTADNPIVKVAKSWAKVLLTLEKQPGGMPIYAQVFNKNITIDAEGIVIMFEEKEQTSRQIVSMPMNINNIKNAVKKAFNLDLKIKALFKKEIDDIIDINKIGRAINAEPQEKNVEQITQKTEEIPLPDEPPPQDDYEALSNADFNYESNFEEIPNDYEIDKIDNVVSRAADITDVYNE